MANKTVLVVDDDIDIRTAIQNGLEYDGYDVIAAPNGLEGLRILKDHDQVGLIFLDMMMPVMNGREFLNALQNDDAFSEIPVVVISANSDAESAKGAAAFLKKPAGLETLLDAVHEFYPNDFEA